MTTPDSAAASVAHSAPPPNALFLGLFGCFSIVYGALLVPIGFGLLRHDANAATAMFVVVFAIMIGFLGLTPVGTFTPNRPLLWLGLVLVLLGSLAFISPGTLTGPIHWALAAMLLGLGLIRLPLFWWHRRHGAKVPDGYALPYTAMHLLSLALGVVVVTDAPWWLSAPLLLGLGASQVRLAVLAARPGAHVPGAARLDAPDDGRRPLRLSSRLMLLLAITMLFMAVATVLGVRGVIPIDTTRSSLLFVLITAMQVILLGDTPVRSFTPSWTLALLGMAVATLAMVAAIVPGVLDGPLGVAVGVSNLATAATGFVHLAGIVRTAAAMPPGRARRTTVTVVVVSAIVYCLLLAFAVNLLAPGLIPGLAMLAVLVLAGGFLIWLAFLLSRLPRH